jgi:hypothetical protein
MMNVSRNTVIITAAVIWYAGGVALLLKGSALIISAYLMDHESVGAVIAAFVGIGAGFIKGGLLFSKNCERNIKRINAIADPNIWHCFTPGMLVFLAVIIPAGAWMSRAASGNYMLLCLIGSLDLSISIALLTSSRVFWKK